MKNVSKLEIRLGKKVPDPIRFGSNEIWTSVMAETKQPYSEDVPNLWQENTALCVKNPY